MSNKISDKQYEPRTGGELVTVPIRTAADSSSSASSKKEAVEAECRPDESLAEPRQGDEQPDSGATPDFDYGIAAAAAIAPAPITTWWISRPPTSRAFYTKAAEHNESLTRLERLYLRSRLDLPGKALSCPDETTAEEADQIIVRPPPAILNQNLAMFSYKSTSPSSSGEEKQTAIQPETIRDVVDAYHINNRAGVQDLSFDALECVVYNWWKYSQALLIHPWERECWDEESNEQERGASAASHLLCKGRKDEVQEGEFRQKLLEIWVARQDKGESSTDMDNAFEGINGENEEMRIEEANQRLQGLVDQANKLREEMLEEVRAELEGLSEEEKKSMQEMREREIQAIALEPEKRKEEMKRKKEEEHDEKRGERLAKKRKQELNGADGGHVGGYEKDDGERGYDIFLLPV